jgi:uncharacterized protein (TIGR00255 family)
MMAATGLCSMTGFGESRAEIGSYTVMVTVRSVNSRYLDFRFKAPSICAFMEPMVRQRVKQLLVRGKVELNLALSRNPAAADAPVQVDIGLARAYKQIFLQLQQELGLTPGDIPLSLLAAQPEVLVRNSLDADQVSSHAEQYLEVVEEALRFLREMQEVEGRALQEDLLVRCEQLESLLDEVSLLVQDYPQVIRDRLAERIKKLLDGLAPVDEERVYQEAAQLAEKADITEEIVRFKSHCQQFFRTIREQTGSRGKKLDFIIQELLRETNTIGSKASSLPVVQVVVQIKDELEKLREQVQNVA